MPLKKKTILTEGRYWIPSLNNFKGGYKTFKANDLHKLASTAQQQQRAGHRIPAPWKHDAKAQPIVIGSDENGSLATSYDNGGFWETIYVGTNDEGKATLEGYVQAPGTEDDPNTPYGKLGTTVKDTSIYVAEKWKDGKGEDWDEPIMHIALVTHPIEPGQDTFQPVNGGMAIAMSMAAPEVDVPELLANLQKKVGINLPGDTNKDNILERLNVALLQISDDSGAGTTTRPPKGGHEVQPSVLAMSMTNNQLLGMLTAQNPETGKNYTQAEVEEATGQKIQMSTPAPAPQQPAQPVATPPVAPAAPAQSVAPQAPQQPAPDVSAILMSHLQHSEKQRRIDRVNGLIAKGLDPEFAKKELQPMLDSFQMSFGADNQPNPQPIDAVLNALEKANVSSQPADSGHSNNLLNDIAMSTPPQGGTVVGLPNDTGQPAWENEEQLNKAVEQAYNSVTPR